jgi:hypothetical protein
VSFSVTYLDAITVTNAATTGPGTHATGTFDLTGTLTLSSVSGTPQTTGSVSNVFDNPSGAGPLGGVYYIGQATNFANLTINGVLTGSNFGGQITAVPEPSSVALACVGGLLLLAPVLRRKARVQA